jgi:transposase
MDKYIGTPLLGWQVESQITEALESMMAQIDEQAELIANQTKMITKMEILIKYYEEQLLLMKRRQFGASSERTMIDMADFRQPSLFNEVESEADKALPEPEIGEAICKRKKRKGKREDDLSGLPVERVDYEIPEGDRGCPKCGDTMRDIGVDVRRRLKLIPAQVVVEEEAIHGYACNNPECEGNNGSTVIIKADSPVPLISGSIASPSLVAHITMQKYSNGMPLYRVEKGFQYDGVEISRQTMSNWVIKCVDLYLVSIYSLMIKHLLKETVLHADETTVQVLHEPGRSAQSKSYEWLYRTSGCSKHKIVIYDYKETRDDEHPQNFLKDFKGFLHTDGYQGYHCLPPDITVVGCWFHVRQKWENLLKIIPENKRKGSDAERGVAYVNQLFKLERSYTDLSPDERFELRLEKSKPVSDAFFEWVDRLGALPKSVLGEATHYSLSQRKYLENVYLDGRLELSNNRAERSIKPFVMGRKAWLFSNTSNGAFASSVMYSIIETAKENGLHPFHYIKFLLETLPNTTTDNLEALLPWSDFLPWDCRVPVKQTSEKRKI